MHGAAFNYVRSAVFGLDFQGQRVLEIGSQDVNGSGRALFSGAAEYIGLDQRAGRGVDVVCDVRDYLGSGFDVVVSTEALEHDPHPQDIIQAARRLLKPGGMLILTAAGPGRPAHNHDGTPWKGQEPYGNIEPGDLECWLEGWDQVEVVHNELAMDVYARARRCCNESTSY